MATHDSNHTKGPLSIPRATREGTLRFGAIDVPCFVLADGTALLTTRGITGVFAGRERGDLGSYLARIPEEYRSFPLDTERSFRLPENNAVAKGYAAETLTRICRAYNAAFRGTGLQLPLGVN